MGGMLKVQRDALSRIWPTQPPTVCAQHAEVNRRSAKDLAAASFCGTAIAGCALSSIPSAARELANRFDREFELAI
jgi:hypothetical protein